MRRYDKFIRRKIKGIDRNQYNEINIDSMHECGESALPTPKPARPKRTVEGSEPPERVTSSEADIDDTTLRPKTYTTYSQEVIPMSAMLGDDCRHSSRYVCIECQHERAQKAADDKTAIIATASRYDILLTEPVYETIVRRGYERFGDAYMPDEASAFSREITDGDIGWTVDRLRAYLAGEHGH